MISKDREYRSFDLVQSDEMVVEGIAVVFDQPTVLFEDRGVKYYEVIKSGALDGADLSDVVLNRNHTGRPAAKTKNRTLDIDVRNNDVFIKADLSKCVAGRELHEEVRNEFIDKMSFAFTVAEHSYDEITNTRTIIKIDRLYDVSAVDSPAYDQTSIYARSSFEAEVSKVKAEALKKEQKLKLIRLRARAIGENHEEN